ncbi:MAG: CvpA family protein [Chitinophagaceae bacterium]|nr:CvpA family protein [Chitinophagaceae bacterium]
MFIDIILIILLITAVIKGMRNGFVVAVFSFLAIIIGLAAALKLSTWVAGWLKESTSISASWLPFLAFALVMIGVIVLVRLGALAIQSALKMVMMGWLNKLAGIVLYAALYITLFSVLLFYAEKIHLLKPATISASQSYAFIQPWGPKAMEWFGALIPWFRGMFDQLSHFFESIPSRVQH